MKTIFKYILKVEDYQELELPKGSVVLSVEEQREEIVLYALVENTSEGKDTYDIIIHGTGHNAGDIKSDDRFLGTVKMHDGLLMFHVFCKLK